MASLMLDTSILVTAEHDRDALDAAIDDDDDIAVAALSVAELRVGVGLARGRRREQRRQFVDEVVSGVPVIAYDLTAADAHADLLLATRRAGRPRGAHDLIIAACAVASRRLLVTADEQGLTGLPGLELRVV